MKAIVYTSTSSLANHSIRMSPRMSTASAKNTSFYQGGKLLGRLAIAVQFGSLLLGLSLFLDQCRDLLSDAQFTWGERKVMAIAAIVTLGGCGLGGWVLARLLKLSAGVLD